MINMLRKLARVSAVSGGEEKIFDAVSSLVSPFVDDIKTDALGNIIALKRGTGVDGEKKKIVLTAHIDEVGFIVTDVCDDGFVRFGAVGGVDMASAAYSSVEFENGVFGVIIPESGDASGEKDPSTYLVDIGAKDKKSAARRVKTGDLFRLKSEIIRLAGKRVAGRPLDNRIGAAILAKVASDMKSAPPFNDVYFVFSVQEEVGCRGAGAAAFSINPDFAVAVDVTDTGDYPGAKKLPVKLGGGAAIKIMDRSVVCDQALCGILKGLAKENKIKYQLEVLTYGSCDASAIQRTAGGIPSGAVSVPARYIHTAREEIDMDDAAECLKLITALCGATL